MPEHRTLTGASLHEPKGISTAGVGTVYTANGAGSGAWTAQTASVYGGLGLHNTAVAIATIGTTPKKVDVFALDYPSNGVTVAHATDSITIVTTGVYQVDFSMSFATAAVGDAGLYQFRLRIDGVEPAAARQLGVQRSLSGSTDTGAVGFCGIVALTAGEVLTIWVESDEAGNTDDISVTEAQFLIHLLRAT